MVHAYVTLIVHWSSWSMSYCASRTLINATETSLSLLALRLLRAFIDYPHFALLESTGGALSRFAALVAALVYVRPTAALLWVRERLNYYNDSTVMT
jgi:hypothetical protein